MCIRDSGSSAANGVVLITTKKGQEGKLQISFSSSSEFSKAYMMPEFQNTYGNKEGMFESWGDKLARPLSLIHISYRFPDGY